MAACSRGSAGGVIGLAGICATTARDGSDDAACRTGHAASAAEEETKAEACDDHDRADDRA